MVVLRFGCTGHKRDKNALCTLNIYWMLRNSKAKKITEERNKH